MDKLQNGSISIRKFEACDVQNKVNWINDSKNNTYLHYDLPLEYDKTMAWFERIKDSDSRLDAVILYDEVPVGLVGLLGIDRINKKAEYYVCMGSDEYKGKGIARVASELLVEYSFSKLGLNKIYLYTEEENTSAQRLFEKIGFVKEGLLKADLIYNGRVVNRYVYGLLKEDVTCAE